MSPNPEIISQSPESEVDKNLVKVFVIGLLGVAASFFLFHFFNRYLLNISALYFWLSVLFTIVFCVVNILAAFFVKGRPKLIAIAFLESLAVLFPFYSQIISKVPLPLIAAAVLFFIFLVVSINRAARHLANSLQISFWPTARAILPAIMTGLLVLMAVVLYLSYFSWGNFKDAMGQNLVNGILNSADPILGLQFPKTSFNDTVQGFFAHIAEAELRKINLSSLSNGPEIPIKNFDLLSPAAQQTMVVQVAAALKSQAEKAVGSLNDNAKVNIIVYQLIRGYANRLSPGIVSALGWILALLIFLTLRSVAALFYWFITLIAFVLFKFSIVVGFAYVNLETRSREYIMLS